MDKAWKALRTLFLLSSLVSVGLLVMNRQLFTGLLHATLNPGTADPASPAPGGVPGEAAAPAVPAGLDASKLAQMISAAAPNNARAQMASGALLLKQNKTEEALAALRRAAELDPKSVEARFQIGMILLKHDQLKEAGEQFREAVRLDPAHINSRFGLATVLQQTATLGEAADQYREILKLSPDNAEAYNNLGIVYDAQGDRQTAIEYFKKSLESNPNDETVKQNLASTEADLKMFMPTQPADVQNAPAAQPAVTATVEPGTAPEAAPAEATLHLTNGRSVQGRILQRTDSGVWLEVGNGKVFFSNAEISETS